MIIEFASPTNKYAYLRFRKLLLCGNSRTRCVFMEYLDRKQPAHMPFIEAGNRSVIVFLTICTKNRDPRLATTDAHNLIIDSWERADSWRVGKYVIMPDHIHLFCSPNKIPIPSLKSWVQYWKKEVSRAWSNKDDLPIWQKGYWDTQMRKGDSYTEKRYYIERNPIRKGLIAEGEKWKYQGELNVLRWHD